MQRPQLVNALKSDKPHNPLSLRGLLFLINSRPGQV